MKQNVLQLISPKRRIQESNLDYPPKRLENNKKHGIYLAVVDGREQQTSIGGINMNSIPIHQEQ